MVRSRKLDNKSPCTPEIAALLTCWATSSTDSPSCIQTVQALTECMRKVPKKSQHATTINYHLARLGKFL
ncbi:4857_t:CDS:2 [Funneliformis mosseae]|uniref:4857_t:CDS:1 n=1 Tax=Funneliformis mosseae TaxID=27381 RepID=A0A9N8Z1H6_FUNMO|nr:4857_t:CDS:2 [Funneliformis mosseae]